MHLLMSTSVASWLPVPAAAAVWAAGPATVAVAAAARLLLRKARRDMGLDIVDIPPWLWVVRKYGNSPLEPLVSIWLQRDGFLRTGGHHDLSRIGRRRVLFAACSLIGLP